jgi:hypothetical protein
MQKAKLDGVPLKVSMLSISQEEAPVPHRVLDPMMPAKKRPILTEASFGCARLQPGVPVKKRITPWMLAEPIRMLPAVPR